jgi:hypothetical protein
MTCPHRGGSCDHGFPACAGVDRPELCEPGRREERVRQSAILCRGGRRPGTRLEPPLPPVATQAAGFVATAGAVVASGLKRASAATRAARLAICQGDGIQPRCDFYRPDGRCAKCGCGLANIGGKVTWEAARCPVGKW